MASRHDLPVVVGVDGSSASIAAAEYAADEATLRKAPLRVSYAHNHGTSKVLPPHRPEPDPSTAILASLEAAAERVRGLAPAVEVAVEMLAGKPGPALVDRSRNAQLLVVGHAGFGGGVLGSVARHVATHAMCPVIVHRPFEATSHGRPVMVGVDGSALSAEAARFAFDEAAMRGVGLEAVLVWTHPPGAEPAGVHPVAYDYAEARTEAERMLAEQLAGLLGEYPDVRVTRDVIHSMDPVRTLLDLSRRAQLVVVGSSGRSGIARLLLGSVSQALVNRAPCPVAIVRPGHVVMTPRHRPVPAMLPP
jgi:nucleotide-binding universal stress UspA family protein